MAMRRSLLRGRASLALHGVAVRLARPLLDLMMAMALDNGYKSDGVAMRRFYLNRVKDQTGVSRTGRVLEGVVTQSGKVIVEWRPPHSSVAIYASLAEFLTIHVDCHPSCSDLVWIDAEPRYQEPPRDQVPFSRADCNVDYCDAPSICRRANVCRYVRPLGLSGGSAGRVDAGSFGEAVR